MHPDPTIRRVTLMKTFTTLTVIATWLAFTGSRLTAQSFDSGSDGSYGPLSVVANTTLDIPPDGIFKCTTITVASGATLAFNRNSFNTPVYLLATGNVTIDGTISVSAAGQQGGPGGFDGGNGADAVRGAAWGQGPGGGAPNIGGRYDYGSPLLVPLLGGSGGGGGPSAGNAGGGGGGALLIASNTRIDVPGTITALGSFTGAFDRGGSGGAIRLLAPIVVGGGRLNADALVGGPGRIRIDGIQRSSSFVTGSGRISGGAFMTAFPPSSPRLDIVEAADSVIALGTTNTVTIQLPFGSTTNRTIKVRAENFGALLPINVVLTPEEGERIVYSATIDNATSNPATNVINVAIPANVVVRVNAWTQ